MQSKTPSSFVQQLQARVRPWLARPGVRRTLDRLHQYVLLTRLNRPIGIYLLLWPMLWALWIAAEGIPNPHVLAVFVLGTALMRSAGCAINDYADRHFDPQVARTRARPLAAGTIQPREAVAVFVVLALLAFGLVLTANALTIQLSVGGVLLAACYPYAKRHTYLPQVVLGGAFGWAVPMAFAAQTGELPKIAWLLSLAALLWAVAYDTMYAMADRPDAIKAGVKSTAILFGDADRHMVGLFQILVVLSLLLIGVQAELGWIYFGVLIGSSALFGYQQLLIRDRKPAACIRAFLNNHYFGMLVFAGIVLDYALLD